MAHHSDDLFTLRGRVITARPGVTPDFVTNCLNDRMRQIIDSRTFWADLLTPGILSFPDQVSSGLVNLTTGSAVVSGIPDSNGNPTNWPVSDVVNTIIPAGVDEFGYVEIFPASMVGITSNSMLYCDAAGTPEIIAVVELRRASFIAQFQFPHAANCTLTQSSLVGRQFRLNQSFPVFTINAVTAPDQLILNMPWGVGNLTNQTYFIRLMYVTLPSDMKAIIAMKDEQAGYPVRLHVEQAEADFRDPRRTQVAGNPWYSLVDMGANPQGNMLYEMWPAPANARQFSYYYWKQWPDLVKDTDRPPPFINPSILFYGALADAKMHRTERNDAYYDPAGAQFYEQKFMAGVEAAKNADEAKRLEAMRNPWWKSMLPGNYDMMQLNIGLWDMGGNGFY